MHFLVRKLLSKAIMSFEQIYALRMMHTFEGEEMCIQIGDMSIYGPRTPAFAYTLYRIKKGRFEPFTATLFRQAVQPGMTVLDVGANLGFYTLLAARTVGPTGIVFAFEPDPYVYPWLVRNVEANGFEEYVYTLRKGVASRSGKRTLFCTYGSGRTSLFRNTNYEREHGEELTIETTTLDEFCAARIVPDVVKIDVEGAEIEVLKGMLNTAARSQHLRLFIECAPRGLREAGHSPSKLMAELFGMGFRMFLIDDLRSRLEPINSSMEAERIIHRIDATVGHANLLCVKGDGNNVVEPI